MQARLLAPLMKQRACGSEQRMLTYTRSFIGDPNLPVISTSLMDHGEEGAIRSHFELLQVSVSDDHGKPLKISRHTATYTCQMCRCDFGARKFDQKLLKNHKHHQREKLQCTQCAAVAAERVRHLHQLLQNNAC